ncbi:MAG: protein-ADP-ribose hydrolase [Bacillota bacterium]|nr:protein-ADP-ribose hydrolase [Bacillota bacterium]
MNQVQKRKYLIQELLNEHSEYRSIKIPIVDSEQNRMLRTLMNIRLPKDISESFIRVQDAYLQEVNRDKGIVTLEDMEEIQPDFYLWKGDITRLKVGAIVNAANSGMRGCFQPCHNCIDNCIHTYAGIQLRNYCDDLMNQQGYEEPTGQAKITPAFNLPCDYILHTVGPIVQGKLSVEHEKQLESCYKSCLEMAEKNGISSIAFCCISTGVFMFPNFRAAEIAIQTVKKYKEQTNSKMKVVFNVFKDEDEKIYEQLLR